MEILNRKAKHDYFIEETYEAGIALTGTEIKSVREGNCNIKDSYGIVRKGEVYLLNMFIGIYKQGNIFNHEETRTRKLLLHKNEIRRIEKAKEEKRMTLIPIKLYFKENKLKVMLGICRGKKDYDKRESLKQKDIKKEVARNIKNF